MNRIAPLLVLVGIHGLAQTDAPKPARQEFEVASIKPHTADDRRMVIMPSPGGRLNVEGMTLKLLMTIAYRIQDYQISGGPGWIGSDRFDIVAKAEEGSNSKIPEMLQALLEDRFKLTIHRETKEMPIYALVVAKGGPKFHESEGECPPRPSGPPPPPVRGKMANPPCGGMLMAPNQTAGSHLAMEQLAVNLSRILGRTVIDKTGLNGKYDIKLEWTPDQSQMQLMPGGGGPMPPPPPDSSGPTIYTALQEQLGLKLESQKGPVEILVIDHVEQPSEN